MFCRQIHTDIHLPLPLHINTLNTYTHKFKKTHNHGVLCNEWNTLVCFKRHWHLSKHLCTSEFTYVYVITHM